MRFASHTVVVTGASRGLGRHFAEAFAREGAFVVVGYRARKDEAEATLAACRAHGADGMSLAVDVRDRASVQTAFDAVFAARGSVDVLINNAGVHRDGMFALERPDDWDEVLGVNLGGVHHCTHAVARPMMARRSGAIVNVASVSAMRAVAGRSSYAATKAGVVAFTRVVARELAPHGVRVNALIPGFVDAGMAERMDRRAKETTREAIPLGRFGAPAEIAAAALFLASNEARYVVGHALVVDGGLTS